MSEPQPEACFVTSDWACISGVRRFCHEAMATTFEIIMVHEDERYSGQAARAAFDELDRLEGELSRFIENSDISRVNSLAAGQPAIVGLDALECLKLSAKIHDETDGAFDVTIGSLFRCWLDEDKKLRSPSEEELSAAREHTGMELLLLDEAEHTVRVANAGVQVDLGGVGKGYAVDRMGDLLREWSVEIALIHGGYSTVLALGAATDAKGWPVALRYPGNDEQPAARLLLQNRALSGSGLQQGRHIIDPRTAKPAEGKLATWACAADAVTADALSTAFMVMTPDEIKEYCLRHPDAPAMVLLEDDAEPQKGRMLHYGRWDEHPYLDLQK